MYFAQNLLLMSQAVSHCRWLRQISKLAAGFYWRNYRFPGGHSTHILTPIDVTFGMEQPTKVESSIPNFMSIAKILPQVSELSF